jgi:uncharacterized membrane protein YhaH (DUF805 family)
VIGFVSVSLTGYMMRRDDAEHLFNQNRGGKLPGSVELRPQFPGQFGSDSSSWIILTVVLDDFDPNSGELRGTVSGAVDREAFAKEYPGAEPPGRTRLTLMTLYRSKSIEIELSPSTAASDTDQAVSVPINLETWGARHAFPGDSYAATYFIHLEAGQGFPSTIVVVGPRLADYIVSGRIGGTYFNVLLKRGLLQQIWIYALIASAWALFAALVVTGRRTRDTGSSAIQASIGVLALIPLRQVLVPADLKGMTDVDILLGIEFFAFMMWALIATFYLDQRRHKPEFPQTPIGTGGS